VIVSDDRFAAVMKMALCYWSDGDERYQVHSPLLELAVGEGDTPEEAWREFRQMVEEARREAEAPKKEEGPEYCVGEVPLRERVKPSTWNRLEELRRRFGCSRADVLAYLLDFHEVGCLPDKPGRPPLGSVRYELPLPCAIQVIPEREIAILRFTDTGARDSGNGQSVVRVPGEPFIDLMEERSADVGNWTKVLINLDNIDLITPRYLNGILKLHSRLEGKGGRLVLSNLHSRIGEVFALLKLDNILTVCPDEAEALKLFDAMVEKVEQEPGHPSAQGKLRCPQCRALNGETAKFCNQCGAAT
jgi:anti-anti-sigma regulatory factor